MSQLLDRPPEPFRPHRPEVINDLGGGKTFEIQPGVVVECLVGAHNHATNLTTGVVTIAPSIQTTTQPVAAERFVEVSRRGSYSARPGDAEYSTGESKNAWLFSVAGVVALGALVTCLAIFFWVLLADSQTLAERLNSHRVWLSWASVTHLLACAVWVTGKVR